MNGIELLYSRIEQLLTEKRSVFVAIDGNSAAGKTTLANLLQGRYQCNVFHMDDFFLRPHQRTPERLKEIGGNVDYGRFRSEVIEPLICGKPFCYRPFNCQLQELCNPVSITPKQLNIVEGVYSLHPTLIDVYDLKVFLNLDEPTQRERITQRNAIALQKRFFQEWIPMENRYFNLMHIAEQCDLVFNAAELISIDTNKL